MEKISPTKALFIKLGAKGSYEKECIEERNIVKLDYKEIDHNLCLAGRWQAVRKVIMKKYKTKKVTTTFHLNQIKYFYEVGQDVLWITFYHHKLWWCFADKKVIYEKDGTKFRKVLGKWRNKGLGGQELRLGNLSGRLLRTQGFRGVICRVIEKNYLLNKINGEELAETKEVKEAFNLLCDRIVPVIKNLNWKNFERLIDLIFRNAGWQRISELGQTQRTIDLELVNPITGERAVAQVKSESNLKEFNRYKKEFGGITGYDKFFYLVHTPTEDLKKYKKENREEKIKIYFASEIAELAVNAGLFNWVLRIVG